MDDIDECAINVAATAPSATTKNESVISEIQNEMLNRSKPDADTRQTDTPDVLCEQRQFDPCIVKADVTDEPETNLLNQNNAELAPDDIGTVSDEPVSVPEVHSDVSPPDIPSESENLADNDETSRESDDAGNVSSEEPAIKKRRRILTPPNNDDDDDESDDDVEQGAETSVPFVVESCELNDENEAPKPKCKKASTKMLKEFQARVLLESAVMIQAANGKKKLNRILDSDEDDDEENRTRCTDNGLVNDISDIGMNDDGDAVPDEANAVDVVCNKIRNDEDDNFVMIQEEVFISQQQNNLNMGTEMETTCKMEDEREDGGSAIDSDNSDSSMHSNSSHHENNEAAGDNDDDGPMAGIFETESSDSSQGEEILGHDPHSDNEFMTTSDVEKSHRLNNNGTDNDDDGSANESDTNANMRIVPDDDSEIEEGEIRINPQMRQKLPSTSSSSGNESGRTTPVVRSPFEIKSEKEDFEMGEVKLVDLPSIKIIDVKTINDIVNSVDSSLISNDSNHKNNNSNSSHSNNNNNHCSKGSSSSKSHANKTKPNQDPFFDYSSSSSSDEFIPNEIYFGTPDLLARHQRRRARRKESRRNNHKHKRRNNSYARTTSSSDSDSMGGRYSKNYLSHHNRTKSHNSNAASAKHKKRKKRKNDRFYDRSRDIPPEIYFGDVQVPLHVLHSYGATSNSHSSPSDSDSSLAYRKAKSANRSGTANRSNHNNNNNNKSSSSNNNNNNRRAAASSRPRRYSSSSSISTVNSIVSPSRDNLIETMKRYLKAAGIMRQIKLNRLWEGCKSNKERADKILEVLREKGLEGEPTMAKCKELKIRLQTKKELEELNPNVIIVTEGRSRRSTTRAATEKSLQVNPLESCTASDYPQTTTSQSIVASGVATSDADGGHVLAECSSTLIKLQNVIDPDSE